MSDAPERIWAWTFNDPMFKWHGTRHWVPFAPRPIAGREIVASDVRFWQFWRKGWWFPETREFEQNVTEYRRADLPPTLAAALALPEIAAIVEAAWFVHYRKTGATSEIRKALKAFPALSALRAAREKE